jgi:hypothetical protein
MAAAPPPPPVEVIVQAPFEHDVVTPDPATIVLVVKGVTKSPHPVQELKISLYPKAREGKKSKSRNFFT